MTTRLSIVAIALLTTAACAERNEFAVFEFEVMDGEVVCDTTGVDGSCRSPHPRMQVKREYIRTPGSISMAGPASNNLWWMELAARRTGNTRARMTLTGPGGKFMESRFQTRGFDSRQTSGVVLLPENNDCPCQAGQFELSFRAPGRDGIVGTADDEQRRLSRGRIRTDGRPFCQRRAVLPIVEGELVVKRVACPVDPGFTPNGSNGTVTSTPAPGDNSGWSLGFDDHPECIFFGWDDDDQWVWTGDSSDWDAQQAEEEGWYDDDWASSDDNGEGWSDSWDDSFGDSGGSGNSWSGDSGGGSWGDDSSDDWGSWGDDSSSDWGDDSWGDDWGSDDSSDWGDSSSDDDYWDDDDGW